MADLNDLLVRIDATTEQLRREMKRADSATANASGKIDKSLRRVDRSMDRMNKTAARAAKGLVAMFGAISVARAVQGARSIINVADATAKAANVAGIGAEALQELRFALGQLAGTTDRDVDLSLQRFNRRLGLARDGAKNYGDALRNLGVDIRSDTGPALEQALRSLANIPNASDRAALASQIFGEKAGPKLAAALSGGIEGVERLRRQINEDGGIISSESLANAEEFNDTMDRIGRQFTAETADAILQNADALKELAKAFGGIPSAAIKAFGFLGSLTGPSTTGTLADANADPLLAGRNSSADVPNVARFGNVLRVIPSPGDGPATPQPPQPLPSPVSIPQIERKEATGTPVFNAKLKEAQRFFDQSRTEAEQIEAQIARVQELAAEGFFTRAGIDDGEILRRLNQQLDEVKTRGEETASVLNDAFAGTVGGALEEMFARGEISASNFAESLLRDLARITAQLLIIQPLIGALFPGGGGGLFGAIGGLFGGGRAQGGVMEPGRSYMVGERGPERVTPMGFARVTPNSQMSRPQSEQQQVVIAPTINAPGADAGTIARIEVLMREQFIPQAVQAATSNTLSRLSRPRFA